MREKPVSGRRDEMRNILGNQKTSLTSRLSTVNARDACQVGSARVLEGDEVVIVLTQTSIYLCLLDPLNSIDSLKMTKHLPFLRVHSGASPYLFSVVVYLHPSRRVESDDVVWSRREKFPVRRLPKFSPHTTPPRTCSHCPRACECEYN